MKIFNSILEISENFEGFILDVWGVLHASGVPFEGVTSSLEELKRQGKKILLLSNAPRRSTAVSAFLAEKIGVLEGKHYDGIITSGEAFFLGMVAEQGNVFYIGPEKDLTVLNGLALKPTQNLNDSFEFAIITGIVPNGVEVLHKLKAKNTKLYCLNPDIFITKADGTTEECAGFLAKKYKEMGGEVCYFGKPYPEIYQIALKFFDQLPKAKILAVGDGMETDILGANKASIPSCLCLAGLPSINLKKGQTLENFLKEFEAKPNFIIKKL